MSEPCSCGCDTGLRQYINRHGDIELLCAACYALAVYPKESPELRRRDRRVAALLAVIAAGVIAFGLFGCATVEPRRPAVNRILIANQVVTEWTDAADAPDACGDMESGQWAGCYRPALHRIDYRSPVYQHTMDHERGHAAGMWHGPYSLDFAGRVCAPVLLAGGKYHAGDRICFSHRGEDVIPASYFAEAK